MQLKEAIIKIKKYRRYLIRRNKKEQQHGNLIKYQHNANVIKGLSYSLEVLEGVKDEQH